MQAENQLESPDESPKLLAAHQVLSRAAATKQLVTPLKGVRPSLEHAQDPRYSGK